MKKILILIFIHLFLVACSSNQNHSIEEDNTTNTNLESEEQQAEQDSSTGTEQEQQENETVQEDAEQSEFEMNKSVARDVLTNYKDTFTELIDRANQGGRLEQFQSFEELREYLQSAMSDDLAQMFVDTYFRKSEDGAIILKAMDAPTWLDADQSFRLEEIANQKWKITQERNNELLGHRNMIYILTRDQENWIVDDVQSEEVKPENQSEPEGITEETAVSNVRDHLEISEDSDTIVEMDHLNENGNYVVHVYDVIEHENDQGSHTATVGWYIVNKKSGEINNLFE